jgi:predicted nucleic acid-binding protein
MHPSRASGRRVHEFAELWLDPLWKLGRMASRRIIHRFRHHQLSAGSVGNYTNGIVHGGIAAGELESYLRLSLASCRVIMRRIVIDTNVFVAAGFNPRSAAARILTAVREGRFQLIWNDPTRRETEMILRRIPHIDWARASDLFQPETEFTGPVDPESFALVPDPEDRKFAALSAAAQTPLVTNDHDLLSRRNIIGVDALTPRAFLAREGEDTRTGPTPLIKGEEPPASDG